MKVDHTRKPALAKPFVKTERKDGLTEAQLGTAKAIFEDKTWYEAWRVRMGLVTLPEAPVRHDMRARIAAELRKIGVGLSAIPDEKKFKPSLRPYALPDKAVPIGASDALRENNMRRAEAEKSLPF